MIKITNQETIPQINKVEKNARIKAIEFEEIFLNSMLKPMFATNQKNKEYSQKMYESLFIEQVAKAVARTESTKIADNIYNQIMKGAYNDSR